MGKSLPPSLQRMKGLALKIHTPSSAALNSIRDTLLEKEGEEERNARKQEQCPICLALPSFACKGRKQEQCLNGALAFATLVVGSYFAATSLPTTTLRGW
jgi:hypothetical protein